MHRSSLNRLARFSVLTRCALAFVIDLLKAVNSSSLFVMLFLLANVVYHPIRSFVPNNGSLVKAAR